MITPTEMVETKREKQWRLIIVEKNLPEKKFRAGAISATVWKNIGQTRDGNETEFRTVSFERSYKDKNNEWKKTSSLRLNDLPRAAAVLSKAYEYLIFTGSEEAAEDAASHN